ncbi:hypothetical protein BLOT_001373 [Blomia tropicalis]|nr:hypothetical protein BLOT_001373 [Blomia tropicalis]
MSIIEKCSEAEDDEEEIWDKFLFSSYNLLVSFLHAAKCTETVNVRIEFPYGDIRSRALHKIAFGYESFAIQFHLIP